VRGWESLNEPVEKFMVRDYLVVEEEAYVREVAAEMRSRGQTSAIVARRGEPVGIVTERDILYRLVAEGRDPKATRVSEIMSTPIIAVSPEARLSEAIALMASRQVRRLVVVKDRRVLGVLTVMALVGSLTSRAAILPEVEGESVSCPYCGMRFVSPYELSKHIDKVHIGEYVLSKGPLEW